MQFWSEIILVNSNQTRATCLFDFEIARMISDQIALTQFNYHYLSGGNLKFYINNVT